MKRISVFSLALALLASLNDVYAQSPREQLGQLVQQLQAAPNDTALRERIIKLGAEIKPPPAIPEEANRAFIKGGVFHKKAKDASGYELAISAYRDALRIAPWWGDAYFNLSVTLEAAGKFDEAVAATKLYIAAVPPSSIEARDALNRMYALEAESEAASKVVQPLGLLNGSKWKTENRQESHFWLESREGRILLYEHYDVDSPVVHGRKDWCRANGGGWPCAGDDILFGEFTIDGNELKGRLLLKALKGNSLSGTINDTRDEIRLQFEDRVQSGPITISYTLKRLP